MLSWLKKLRIWTRYHFNYMTALQTIIQDRITYWRDEIAKKDFDGHFDFSYACRIEELEWLLKAVASLDAKVKEGIKLISGEKSSTMQ